MFERRHTIYEENKKAEKDAESVPGADLVPGDGSDARLCGGRGILEDNAGYVEIVDNENDGEFAEEQIPGEEQPAVGEQETAGQMPAAQPYAALDELGAAFAAVGEVLENGDLQAGIDALDRYIAIYHRLSPEDQEANAEALAGAQSYRETLAAALAAEENGEEYEDPDMSTMALLVGEQFRIRVNYGYLENGSFHLLASKEMVSTCGYGCGHSGYNHTMDAAGIVEESGYSGEWRVTRYGNWADPASTTNCNYNITGSAPYKADQAIWVYGEKPSTDPVTPSRYW